MSANQQIILETIARTGEAEMIEVSQKISPYIHKTPVMTSRLLNEISGADLYFKCENFQRMGAFKMRGALNAVLSLTEEEKANGVVTHSSGNFAQALSLAAQSLGVPAYIIMPSDAPRVKIEAAKSYGGQVLLCNPTLADRQATANALSKEKKAKFIHPSDDWDVIMGNSTAASELLAEVPELEILIAPVGGGGLLAGTALAGTRRKDPCLIFGGEPLAVDDAYRSLKSGKIEGNATTNTLADGLKTQLGEWNFPVLQQTVTEIITVTEEEIVEAMRLIWERMKIIIEPSCAVPFAAVLKQPEYFSNRKVGIILSGGNVDLSKLPFK
jgi:threonine dehydratase